MTFWGWDFGLRRNNDRRDFCWKAVEAEVSWAFGILRCAQDDSLQSKSWGGGCGWEGADFSAALLRMLSFLGFGEQCKGNRLGACGVEGSGGLGCDKLKATA
jgi:hypothetical protein